MSFKEKVMPALVLMLICIVISGLVIGVYDLTYVDNTGVMTDKLREGLEEIYSTSDGFEILLEENTGDEKVPVVYDGITSIIVNKEKGLCVFEIVADGYEKGGLDMLVGIDEEGKVAGIAYIEVKETKGLGTKVQDSGFVSKFVGMTSDSNIESADSVTGATFSSKGVKGAVRLACDTYSEHKEEIFGE